MFHLVVDLLGKVLATIAGSLGVGIWCAIITLIIPEPIRVARNSALIAPFTAVLVGFLALAAGFGITTLLSLLIVTIICIPVIALVDIFLGALIALGIVVIAEPVGHMILRRRGIYAAPIAAATVGGVSLSVILALLFSLPFGLSVIGYIALAIVLSAGVGSLMLTRLGRRPYPRARYI